MPNVSPLQTLQRLCLALSVCVLASCGSKSPIGEIPNSSGFNVPWPADGAPVRVASDDTVQLQGNEYAMIGGSAIEDGTTASLTGGGDLTYAIYTLGGFIEPLMFSELALDAEVEHATPGDSTQLYVGLANYSRTSWEWYAADSGGWSTGPLNGTNYHSPIGTAGVAVVLDGPGSASIRSLTFTRTGDTTLLPPDPIFADPVVGRITISWDRVPVAEGYNIYRDEEPALPAPQKLNSDPISADFYGDLTVTPGVMYYYFVTSVSRGAESEPSMMLDVFAPEVNLPEPANVRMLDTKPTATTIAWDWEGVPPNQFVLYLDELKDFNLVAPLQWRFAAGSDRQLTFNGLEEGTKYRWRISAVFGGRRGRMTDDRPVVTLWNWGPPETVGNGTDTVVAIKAGSDLAAAYYDTNIVNFARRDNGVWTEETVLDSEMFDTYVDLAYSGGKYLVTGWAVLPGDMWVATGTPGNFTQLRIHGDGSTGLGHKNSGIGGVATATSTEFIVAHTDYEEHATLIQTRPISGGEWSLTSLDTHAWLDTPYNLASEGNNVYLLMKDIDTHALLFGDRNSGWEFTPAIPPRSPRVYFNSDLVRFGDQWVSPLRDASNHLFIMVEGNETPWTIEKLSDDNVGSGARIDAEGSMAGIVYTAWGDWWWAYTGDGGAKWIMSEIRIKDNHVTGRPDIVFLDGSPYLVYADALSGKIKAAKGTPPDW